MKGVKRRGEKREKNGKLELEREQMHKSAWKMDHGCRSIEKDNSNQ